ncbi:MAG: PLP-dependent aminotransferase family protein [Pseudorhodobacter sp.]|nr:PLP-dependent aminotransferase family protein [Pseudorhodobacter sp.]
MTSWHPDSALLTRPAYLSLADQFARAIDSGVLPPGTRLMPHRKLADDLGIAVQTVSRAYDELIRRGLTTGEIGRGTFVLLPGQEARPPYLPDRQGELIDLSILKPVCDNMHLQRMREGMGWLAENLSAEAALSFRPNTVQPRHRIVAADWLARSGVEAAAGNITITNGATSAITSAVMSLVPTGAGLATEALTHHTLMPLCGYLGIHQEGIAMDGQGMLPAALDDAARKGTLRAVYLQPSVINPLAILMGTDRRAELVEVARKHDLSIIENDILNLMVDDRPAPFAALAPERTIHICGFTKITVPGMRIAYLSAPDRHATAVANRHLVSNWMATPAMVELLSHWLSDGTALALINWQRGAIARRHAIAARAFAGRPYLAHPQSLHLWLRLPPEQTEDGFVANCRLRGVAVAAGGAFRATEKGRQDAVRVSLGSTSIADLRRGLGLIARMLTESIEAPLPTI